MAWYQESFGNDYLIVYKHRDMQGAYHEVKKDDRLARACARGRSAWIYAAAWVAIPWRLPSSVTR